MTRRLLLIPVLATALLAPALASADTYMHPANNEKGVVVHPEAFKSDKTRAQVQAEAAAAARAPGGASRFNGNAYPPEAPQADAGKTRQQVIDELASETPQQRKQRLELLRG
ncbi:hypothetical protein GCM10027082_10850 [Comamonas humi]